RDAGCSVALVREAEGRVPVFGVCLGHQAIVEAYGGDVRGAGEIVHGKATAITIASHDIFRQLQTPLTVGRYHSLAAHDLPAPLGGLGSGSGVVMALAHATAPIVGVQFHPESVLTPDGGTMIENVIAWARAHAARETRG